MALDTEAETEAAAMAAEPVLVLMTWQGPTFFVQPSRPDLVTRFAPDVALCTRVAAATAGCFALRPGRSVSCVVYCTYLDYVVLYVIDSVVASAAATTPGGGPQDGHEGGDGDGNADAGNWAWSTATAVPFKTYLEEHLADPTAGMTRHDRNLTHMTPAQLQALLHADLPLLRSYRDRLLADIQAVGCCVSVCLREEMRIDCDRR